MWATDFLLMTLPKGASATIADIQNYAGPRAFKRYAVEAVMAHAMAMTVNDGHGNRAAKRAAREAAAMQGLNGSFPTEQDLITDVINESRLNPQIEYRTL
tara:strand:+ start:1377 stop:1676 length:300 start_codon:yes stop_codon:yes gene_type:complete